MLPDRWQRLEDAQRRAQRWASLEEALERAIRRGEVERQRRQGRRPSSGPAAVHEDAASPALEYWCGMVDAGLPPFLLADSLAACLWRATGRESSTAPVHERVRASWQRGTRASPVQERLARDRQLQALVARALLRRATHEGVADAEQEHRCARVLGELTGDTELASDAHRERERGGERAREAEAADMRVVRLLMEPPADLVDQLMAIGSPVAHAYASALRETPAR
ncbi:hypothetical protein CDCA_CDCA10G2928 [Cyanidium caldarium]|uniref:Uncharacterized protein n=1 Tax=Cyanidium caldarium TaxID=2771 RepID=A0AAV9IXS8_CYACA|nr:hypothetical protein CDCA_CDCA10G2928 [Cyanidium caldarium]